MKLILHDHDSISIPVLLQLQVRYKFKDGENDGEYHWKDNKWKPANDISPGKNWVGSFARAVHDNDVLEQVEINHAPDKDKMAPAERNSVKVEVNQQKQQGKTVVNHVQKALLLSGGLPLGLVEDDWPVSDGDK